MGIETMFRAGQVRLTDAKRGDAGSMLSIMKLAEQFLGRVARLICHMTLCVLNLHGINVKE